MEVEFVKKQLSFVLASLMFLNPAVQAGNNLDEDAVTPPLCAEKKVGIKDKISNKFKTLKKKVSSLDAKTVAKKTALAPFKACWWVLKYELIAAGVLLCDSMVIIEVASNNLRKLKENCISANKKLESWMELREVLSQKKLFGQLGWASMYIEDYITCIDKLFTNSEPSVSTVSAIYSQSKHIVGLLDCIAKASPDNFSELSEFLDELMKAFGCNISDNAEVNVQINVNALYEFCSEVDICCNNVYSPAPGDLISRLDDKLQKAIKRVDEKSNTLTMADIIEFDSDINLKKLMKTRKNLVWLNNSQQQALQGIVSQFQVIVTEARTVPLKEDAPPPTLDDAID